MTTLDKDPIHPKKILFYHNDTKMLILNQVKDTKIYSLDLEKGIVTNEWVRNQVEFINQFNTRWWMDIIAYWMWSTLKRMENYQETIPLLV